MRNRHSQKIVAQIAEDRLEFLVVDGKIILKWKLTKVWSCWPYSVDLVSSGGELQGYIKCSAILVCLDCQLRKDCSMELDK